MEYESWLAMLLAHDDVNSFIIPFVPSNDDLEDLRLHFIIGAVGTFLRRQRIDRFIGHTDRRIILVLCASPSYSAGSFGNREYE